MVSFKNDFQKLNTIKINYILIFYLRKITTSIYILMPLSSARWRALAEWQRHKWRSRRVTVTNAVASASVMSMRRGCRGFCCVMASGDNGWGLGFDFCLAWKHGLKAAVTRISSFFRVQIDCSDAINRLGICSDTKTKNDTRQAEQSNSKIERLENKGM